MTRSSIIDLEVLILRNNPDDRAVLVAPYEGAEGVWLPRSQIEVDDSVDPAVVTLPMWLATEKGLV